MKLRHKHDDEKANSSPDAERARTKGAEDFDVASTRTGEDKPADLSAPSPDAGPDSPTQLRARAWSPR